MLKSVLTFALTRRPIILLCLLVLIGGGSLLTGSLISRLIRTRRP